MRPFILSVAIVVLALGAAWAQSTSSGGTMEQVPYGQTYKNFEFPLYQNGQKTAMLSAAEAKGVSLNRAAATDVKIEIYENGVVTTTVTSPKADLYVADRK